MTIVDELKAMIEARGGEADGVHTISEAVRVLTELESDEGG